VIPDTPSLTLRSTWDPVPRRVSTICVQTEHTERNSHQPLQHQLTTTTQRSCYGPLSGTTRVSRYQKKHSPTHHPDHHSIFISFFHLLRCIASSLFKLHARHQLTHKNYMNVHTLVMLKPDFFRNRLPVGRNRFIPVIERLF